jgi:hypothetical protein
MSTVKDSRAPWETYSQSLDEKLDDRLEAEIKQYSQKRHEKTSEQNAEELARWEEENKNLAKQYQFLSPEEYAYEGARIGRIIHSSEFINMLRDDFKLNCWYRRHAHPDKLTLLVKRNNIETEVGCWVANGYMPEYSIVRFDKYGVVLNEKYRGWRTCLLQMILKGMLDEEDVRKSFGQAKGPASERYNSTLFEIRNHYAKAV